tara:strand:- start:44 stop:298 length:255 start_codon:yes stop_codon:yes gene_type:complete
LTYADWAFGLFVLRTDNPETQTPKSTCHPHLAKTTNASSGNRRNGKSEQLARQLEKRSSELNESRRWRQRKTRINTLNTSQAAA